MLALSALRLKTADTQLAPAMADSRKIVDSAQRAGKLGDRLCAESRKWPTWVHRCVSLESLPVVVAALENALGPGHQQLLEYMPFCRTFFSAAFPIAQRKPLSSLSLLERGVLTPLLSPSELFSGSFWHPAKSTWVPPACDEVRAGSVLR